MNYLIKFDEKGYRADTQVAEEKTAEQVEKYLADGYEIVEEADYQLLIGNVDGKQYIKDPASGEYIEEPPHITALDELKTQKLSALKAERDTLEVQPIEYNGHCYDYDDKARERINAAIIALDMLEKDVPNQTITWTTADNEDVEVNANDLRMVVTTVALRSDALHVAYRNAKTLVEAAESVEELEEIQLDITAE